MPLALLFLIDLVVIAAEAMGAFLLTRAPVLIAGAAMTTLRVGGRLVLGTMRLAGTRVGVAVIAGAVNVGATLVILAIKAAKEGMFAAAGFFMRMADVWGTLRDDQKNMAANAFAELSKDEQFALNKHLPREVLDDFQARLRSRVKRDPDGKPFQFPNLNSNTPATRESIQRELDVMDREFEEYSAKLANDKKLVQQLEAVTKAEVDEFIAEQKKINGDEYPVIFGEITKLLKHGQEFTFMPTDAEVERFYYGYMMLDDVIRRRRLIK